MFSRKYTVDTTHTDANFNLKISSLFYMFQDVATAHVEELGLGKDKVIDKGMYWVITRYSVSINKLPKYLENIVVKTYPGNDMKFIFPRYFKVENESGEVLITASSTWVILNKLTHKIVLHPFNNFHVSPVHLIDEEPLPGKVAFIESNNVMERRVHFTDLDLNCHLNNTKYIDYIIDMHDLDFYCKKEIKHLTINFDREIKMDEKVMLSEQYLNDTEIVIGQVNGENAFSAEVLYKNI